MLKRSVILCMCDNHAIDLYDVHLSELYFFAPILVKYFSCHFCNEWN